MSNRAVVVFEDAAAGQNSESAGIGVYLHWNGGRESVQAFLDVTKERVGHVNLIGFVQTVANFFQYDGYSLYVGPIEKLDTDNGDNGTFYVNCDGGIVRREHNFDDRFDQSHYSRLADAVRSHQPNENKGQQRVTD